MDAADDRPPLAARIINIDQAITPSTIADQFALFDEAPGIIGRVQFATVLDLPTVLISIERGFVSAVQCHRGIEGGLQFGE